MNKIVRPLIGPINQHYYAPRARSFESRVAGLYRSGEPGAWYDPSDMSTLFQDSAGTTPVTAVEQLVGRMLDKSGRGNHASQATTTKRSVYSRRVNTFTRSEFQDGVPGAFSGGLIAVQSLAGYAGSVFFGHDGTTTSYAYKSALPLAGFSAVLSVVVQMTDGGVPVTNRTDASADFMLVMNGNPSLGATVVSLGGGFYRITSVPTVITATTTGVVKYASNSSRTFKVTAYDLRLATDAHLPYQRVNTATDYDADPAKFPAYLRFDGVDDALQTGNINFTGTDKMTVWAGITKLSDASTAETYGFGNNPTTLAGSFMLRSSGGGGTPTWTAGYARGTSPGLLQAQIVAPAPASIVHSLVVDLGGNSLANRVNGGVSVTGGALGGAFGDYPLYIGARAGTSYFFNGRLYSLIVRGAQSSLPQIEATELYIKQKMRMP